MPGKPTPRFFDSPAAFGAWLARHHARATELLVGFHKVGTGRPSLTWPESVDEALCFGWIDGVRRTVDAGRYTIRFTPRKPGSSWSAINVAKVAKLEAEGRMRPAGRAAFARRSEARTAVYSFEQRHEARLAPVRTRAFRANRAAWSFFGAQPPGYRRTAVFWVESAKQEATRERRFATLLADSAAGRRLGMLGRGAPVAPPGRRGPTGRAEGRQPSGSPGVAPRRARRGRG